jgi:hypothetical protein
MASSKVGYFGVYQKWHRFQTMESVLRAKSDWICIPWSWTLDSESFTDTLGRSWESGTKKDQFDQNGCWRKSIATQPVMAWRMAGQF